MPSRSGRCLNATHEPTRRATSPLPVRLIPRANNGDTLRAGLTTLLRASCPDSRFPTGHLPAPRLKGPPVTVTRNGSCCFLDRLVTPTRQNRFYPQARLWPCKRGAGNRLQGHAVQGKWTRRFYCACLPVFNDLRSWRDDSGSDRESQTDEQEKFE